MAREKEGYRDNLEQILKATGNATTLDVETVARVTGVCKRYVTRKFPLGWDQQGRGKRISATDLARQMCRI